VAVVFVFALAPPAWTVCGDNQIDGDESCDGADVGGATCTEMTAGYVPPGQGVVGCLPDCRFDLSDCRRVFIETLIPARSPGKNRCHLEWAAAGTSSRKGGGVQRQCIDGDPGCDADETFNNSCTFRIQVCMNVPDGRIGGCAPARIFRFQVLQPKLTTDVNKNVASGLLDAAEDIAPGTGQIANGAVSFSPPVTEFGCGRSTVTVPLRGTAGKARPGKMKLKARTTDNSGRVKANATLTLICSP
jgi:hypothetical protein